jgi:hypothetical protein
MFGAFDCFSIGLGIKARDKMQKGRPSWCYILHESTINKPAVLDKMDANHASTSTEFCIFSYLQGTVQNISSEVGGRGPSWMVNLHLDLYHGKSFEFF